MVINNTINGRLIAAWQVTQQWLFTTTTMVDNKLIHSWSQFNKWLTMAVKNNGWLLVDMDELLMWVLVGYLHLMKLYILISIGLSLLSLPAQSSIVWLSLLDWTALSNIFGMKRVLFYSDSALGCLQANARWFPNIIMCWIWEGLHMLSDHGYDHEGSMTWCMSLGVLTISGR